MSDLSELFDPKAILQHYLRRAREGLLMKVDGLSERELRMPRTPTGTSLIGIVKHCANVEWGYLGTSFGRAFSRPELLVPFSAYLSDPQVDWFATEQETTADILDLYHLVGEETRATIDALPLDTVGRVPWWPEDVAEANLHHLAVRVIDDTSRHAGQADILRELHDGAVGLHPQNDNIPPGYDWPAYVARLTALAERY
jgi:hypothetical protein